MFCESQHYSLAPAPAVQSTGLEDSSATQLTLLKIELELVLYVGRRSGSLHWLQAKNQPHRLSLGP
jgi:hypothetical protein